MRVILLCIVSFSLTLGLLIYLKKESTQSQIIYRPEITPVLPPEQPIQHTIKTEPLQPQWIHYPPISPANPSLGKVLSDIDSHMPRNHQYRSSDYITWGHETTHGIHSQITNRHPGYEGFYCLNNCAAIILKPKRVRLSDVAVRVPRSARRQVYHLYLVQQQAYWNDYPLYVLNEWIAYINGSEVRNELNLRDTSTIKFMFEFNVYSLAMAKTIKELEPDYDDTQLKAFIAWNLQRAFYLYRGEQDTAANWNAFLTNPDCAELVKFTKEWIPGVNLDLCHYELLSMD